MCVVCSFCGCKPSYSKSSWRGCTKTWTKSERSFLKMHITVNLIYIERKWFRFPSPHFIEFLVIVWGVNICGVTKLKVEGGKKNEGHNKSPTLCSMSASFRASWIWVLKSSLLNSDTVTHYCVEMTPWSKIS